MPVLEAEAPGKEAPGKEAAALAPAGASYAALGRRAG